MLTLSAHNSVLKSVQQILKTDSETTFQGLSNGVGFNRVCHILCERVPCELAWLICVSFATDRGGSAAGWREMTRNSMQK